MADAFRDFIPEGEDVGAQGSGFVDFVPAPEPKLHREEVVEEAVVVEEEKPIKKGK